MNRLLARRQRSRATRATILGAAERVFAEDGLAGARTEAIASRAGVNKALLYYYFKSKDALYRAVLEKHLKEFQRRAWAVLSAKRCARATILNYVETHFDFIAARPYYPRLVQRLVMTGGRPLDRLARKHLAPLYRKLGRVIARGVQARELRAVDGHHTAISLVALTVFYFSAAPVVKAVSHLDPYEKGNLARRKEEVLKFVRYALFRDPEGPFS